MKNLQIQITISPELYIRDPQTTDLGRRIVCTSIEMIDELGFEAFTFRKLGERIGSNESSIYRYFESKHTLMVYLLNWYWSWVEYRLVFATTNVDSSEEKLMRAIDLLTRRTTEDNAFSFINEVTLSRIIIAESSKAYHTKDVDAENEKGFYKTYKRVVHRVSEFVLEVNPDFEVPHMLVSTVIEGAHHQRFFAEHLPSLTDVKEGEHTVVNFYKDLVLKTIQ